MIYEGVPEEKIKIIPVGVDLERFKPRSKDIEILDKFNLEREDIVVLFVGVFNEYKGVYELIYGAKRLLLDKDLDSLRDRIRFVLI